MPLHEKELALNFEPFPILKTDRLILRQFQVKDAVDLFKLRTDDKVMKYLGSPKMKDIDEAKAYIEKARKIKNGDTCIEWSLTLKEEDKLIGKLGFWRIIKTHFRAELGYTMLPSYQSKGIMSEALNAILKYGFQIMKIHSVEANLDPKNEKSVNLLKRNGFTKEGQTKESYYFDGAFTDTSIYGLLKKDWEKNTI